MDTTINNLTHLIGGLNPMLQFLAVFVIGVVPYLESHIGAFVGTVTGIPVVIAAIAAIAGNLLTIFVASRVGGSLARRLAARRAANTGESGPSPRARKVLAKVDRFGVPVASLLGPVVLASGLSTFIMIGAGLNRRTVLVWQTITVVAWGVVFAAIAVGALSFLH